MPRSPSQLIRKRIKEDFEGLAVEQSLLVELSKHLTPEKLVGVFVLAFDLVPTSSVEIEMVEKDIVYDAFALFIERYGLKKFKRSTIGPKLGKWGVRVREGYFVVNPKHLLGEVNV